MSSGRRLAMSGRSDGTAVLQRAWERFVHGENDIRGVRPEVALSWQRSRDQFQVDPFRSAAPPAVSHGGHPLGHDAVFAELGFRAAAVANEIGSAGGLVAISDATGRIFAQWGDKQTRSMADTAGLAPWFCWSEDAFGTNGMGTALATPNAVVMIRQGEHWCQALHEWTCAGVAVRDPVTMRPIAALNISCWRSDLPAFSTSWLRNAVNGTQNLVRKHARDSGEELLAAYDAARPKSTDPLVVVDTEGKVVMADEPASSLLGVPSNCPALDPVLRWMPQLPQIVQIAQAADKQAKDDPEWVGSTHVFTHLSDEPSPVGIRPVFLMGHPIGFLISFGASDGDPLQLSPPAAGMGGELTGPPRRVVGLQGDRSILLRSSEVMLAESDGNDAWLVTDLGRMRAAAAGLDKLDAELATAGFLRVHRRYVVNLSRVREIERRAKGELVLIMDDKDTTVVPVSRRNIRAVRNTLGV